MPQTDQDKDTDVLIAELKALLLSNQTAAIAKANELIYRVIKQGDVDYNEGTYRTGGGIRPGHAPTVP